MTNRERDGERERYWRLVLARFAASGRSVRAFLADGARWLWELADMHFPDAIQILDWHHLSEHVHAAAKTCYGEGTAEAERFSERRLDELWEGRASSTLRNLRALHKQSRSASTREALRQLIGYLKHNRHRINYPRYRALGLPIGSGQVEGACKRLVGARCKQAGMRNWTRSGVAGVLRLRAALQTGHFDTLWTPAIKSAA
jgi:hypothetical protein